MKKHVLHVYPKHSNAKEKMRELVCSLQDLKIPHTVKVVQMEVKTEEERHFFVTHNFVDSGNTAGMVVHDYCGDYPQRMEPILENRRLLTMNSFN